jgi:DNA-binding transcriptional MerR regulator
MKIKTVSDIFGLSDQMLRYYERHHAFEIPRNTKNNYRDFSVRSLDDLILFMTFNDMGITPALFQSMKEQDDEAYREFFEKILQKNQETASRQQVLADHIESALHEFEYACISENLIWMEKRPAVYYLEYANGPLNDAAPLLEHPNLFRKWVPYLSASSFEMLVSCDALRKHQFNTSRWSLIMQKDTAEKLHAKIIKDSSLHEECWALCMSVRLPSITDAVPYMETLLQKADDLKKETEDQISVRLLRIGTEKSLYKIILPVRMSK